MADWVPDNTQRRWLEELAAQREAELSMVPPANQGVADTTAAQFDPLLAVPPGTPGVQVSGEGMFATNDPNQPGVQGPVPGIPGSFIGQSPAAPGPDVNPVGQGGGAKSSSSKSFESDVRHESKGPDPSQFKVEAPSVEVAKELGFDPRYYPRTDDPNQYQAQVAGVRAQDQAAIAGAAEQKFGPDIERNRLAQLQQANRMAADVEESRRLNREYEATVIDPSRAVRNKSTFSKISTVVAGALSGYLDFISNGKTNFLQGVMSSIQQDLDRDVQAQVEDKRGKSYAAQNAKDAAYASAATVDRLKIERDTLMQQAAMWQGVLMEAEKKTAASPQMYADKLAEFAKAQQERQFKAAMKQEEIDAVMTKMEESQANSEERQRRAIEAREKAAKLAHDRKLEDNSEEILWSRSPSDPAKPVKFKQTIKSEERKQVREYLSRMTEAHDAVVEMGKYVGETGGLERWLNSETGKHANQAFIVLWEGVFNQPLYGAPQEGEREQVQSLIRNPKELFANPENYEYIKRLIERRANRTVQNASGERRASFSFDDSQADATSPTPDAQPDTGLSDEKLKKAADAIGGLDGYDVEE